MPDGREPISIKVLSEISEADASGWDACSGANGPDGNPFVSHAFLAALEASGSVDIETGWQPQHLVIEDDTGRIIGAAPIYLKSHSMGEYVFDYGWADAYERAGGRYYPKLQAAVPFTPVMGPRLLARPGPGADRTRRMLIAGMMELTRRHDVSSLHVTFTTEADADRLEESGFLIRHGHQYHWHNKAYETFDDFLAALTSRKRKSIRRERRKVAEAGIELRALTGDAITPLDWDTFYRFYASTYDRKWGYPYLTREFFDIVSETIPDKAVLILADLDGVPVAGALNFRGGDALYGRNWGCSGDFKFLHFEACYYSAIEFAIIHGLARVEAGTQGPHKLQRGYEPVSTFSAHYMPDAGFHEAVARFLAQESAGEAQEMEYLADYGPYRRGDGGN